MRFSKAINFKGLRPSKRAPRNSAFLTQCDGMVVRDGVIQSLDGLTRIDTSAITDGFPYPQIFAFTNFIIVAGQTKIYEWDGSLSEKITVSAGSTWRCIATGGWVYMSNGTVSVKRSPASQAYSLADYPAANAICDFNRQILIGYNYTQ